MRKGANNRSSGARDRARDLRQQMSTSEQIVWQLLRNRCRGFKFRRQHPIGPYFLDFFCREASLALELDGEQHAERRERDERRDAWLADQGIEVIRVPTLDLFEETGLRGGQWLDEVERRCASRTQPSPPTPSPVTNHTGEGA